MMTFLVVLTVLAFINAHFLFADIKDNQ